MRLDLKIYSETCEKSKIKRIRMNNSNDQWTEMVWGEMLANEIGILYFVYGLPNSDCLLSCLSLLILSTNAISQQEDDACQMSL